MERFIFYKRLNIAEYSNIHQLDNALERGLTPIYTIGSNAPYVGLLGTVVGVLITFYDIGEQGGQIEIGKIMIGLALALKATALGICIAIPAIISYNMLTNMANVRRRNWQSAEESRAKIPSERTNPDALNAEIYSVDRNYRRN